MAFSYILLLSVVSIFLAKFTKEISFTYYFIYGVLLLSYILLKNEGVAIFLSNYISQPNLIFIYTSYNWFVQAFFYIFYFLFCYYFLNLHKIHSKFTSIVWKVFTVLMISSVLLFIYCHVTDNRHLFEQCFLFIYMPVMLVLVAFMIPKAARTKGVLKYYVLAGALTYLLFALISLFFSQTHFIESPVIIFMGGIIIENLFFGIGIALKFKHVNDEKNDAKNKAILLESENKISALKGIMEGEEKERSRIAQDLHDGLGSLLTAAKLQILAASNNLGNKDSLAKAQKIIVNASDEVRRVSHNMLPFALKENDILAALNEFCMDISNTSNISCYFKHQGANIRLSDIRQTSLYRIVQELVNNAIRHGDASHIEIELSVDGDFCEMTIENNGSTFQPKEPVISKGLGLIGIQQRLLLLDGKIEYAATASGDNIVIIKFDLSA